MATSEATNTKTQELLLVNKSKEVEHEVNLPKDEIMWFGFPMNLYQGFWRLNMISENINAFQTNFQAHDTDIILSSLPKTGTTWLKSLIFIIVNRKNLSNNFSQHPFQTQNPHELIRYFEFDVYNNIHGNDHNHDHDHDQPDLTKLPSPRLFATHMPYQSMPESIKASKCRIVYIGRNPFDTFISLWHFWLHFDESKGIKPTMELMEEYVGKYCNGILPFGPYEDHLLGYWKESMHNSQKVLFMEYEGLKKEPKLHLKRLAEFVGFPFSEEEEKGSVIDEIIQLCSLKSLKDMEINKSGRVHPWFENKAFFRKGEVGDWINHLTPSMAKSIHELQQKLNKDGFSFTYFQRN